MKKYLMVMGDTNDADYAHSFEPISDAELAELMPLFEAIKNFKPYKAKSDGGLTWTHNHNFPHSEYAPREDLGEKSIYELYPEYNELLELFIDTHCPPGIHSIKEIQVFTVTDVQKVM